MDIAGGGHHGEPILGTVGTIIAIIVLIVLSGFFAGSETPPVLYRLYTI